MSQRSFILCNYNVPDYSILYHNYVRPVICEEGEVLVHTNSLTSQMLLKYTYQARKVTGHVFVY
jgi:hypothetical protein